MLAGLSQRAKGSFRTRPECPLFKYCQLMKMVYCGAQCTARAITEGIAQIPLKTSLAQIGCYRKGKRSLKPQTPGVPGISFPLCASRHCGGNKRNQKKNVSFTHVELFMILCMLSLSVDENALVLKTGLLENAQAK